MKLLKAAEQGDIAALELRLKDGDDIAYVQKSTGLNALITALNCGNDAAARWLVEQRQPAGSGELTTGMSATAWAAFNGRTEMLQVLRQAGPTWTRPGMTKVARRIFGRGPWRVGGCALVLVGRRRSPAKRYPWLQCP